MNRPTHYLNECPKCKRIQTCRCAGDKVKTKDICIRCSQGPYKEQSEIPNCEEIVNKAFKEWMEEKGEEIVKAQSEELRKGFSLIFRIGFIKGIGATIKRAAKQMMDKRECRSLILNKDQWNLLYEILVSDYKRDPSLKSRDPKRQELIDEVHEQGQFGVGG